ncbi:beta-mannosidase [Nocardia sp. NPDC052566]|uniref:beta-mannosidase n=1 Tax=Nocardia sp. NPDC052566 TaxID=3364330 RepID=UPI0037C8D83E
MTRVRTRLAAASLALCAAAGLLACTDQRPPPTEHPTDIVLRTKAERFRLRGQPWWPAGFNAPQLATNWSVNIGCGAQVDLDAYFGALPANALTRFNAFQALAIDKTTGELDFRAVDAVFRAAERHRQLVLPVLAPQDGGCDDTLFKQRQWYVDGWLNVAPEPGRAVMSFHDWIGTAVERWKDIPVLAGWGLVGEPETSVCSNPTCDFDVRTCPPDAAKVLRQFMDKAGAIVRARDPGRLIFAGLTGGGQCGTGGEDYRYVGASPQVDVLEYHDYSPDFGTLPGNAWDGLAVRLRQAHELGKPLFVAEVGEAAGSCLSLTARRENIGMKLTTQRNAGSAGALIWAFVPDPRLDQCTYDVGPEDPLWSLVAERITLD